jgi:hypothetical protein
MDTVKALFRWPVAQVARFMSVVVVSTLAVTGLTVSPSGAASTAMSCSAFVMNVPHPYSLVMIGVATKPHATVTATETASDHSWTMAPSTSANAFGGARLSQRVPAVAKYEIVRVTVHVTLDGLSGHCATNYTPPSLAART